ncbi:thioeseterase [Thioclava sp. SK-1]|uniref:acyl-CoA thioesterase n=1 Tax=Thioclava sp. SK-1 TaxID=1889770 RepID=UPI0008269DD8|nr:acyl-CoA thioesterase [Thioclava sp. SK-1]OCX65813.1 thioeseterase [Thioclava sp. SK-1]
MYPYIRLLKAALRAKSQPSLKVLDTHISHHICWPWDIDPWQELNNGRILTLFDLGRVPLALRTGLQSVLARRGWGIVVAGNTTRYRKRVTMFQRFAMRSRCIGWDDRWIYMEQSMWRNDVCTSHILIRGAVTSKAGIVAPANVMAEMGLERPSPALPDWVQAWVAADALRPWPPEM